MGGGVLKKPKRTTGCADSVLGRARLQAGTLGCHVRVVIVDPPDMTSHHVMGPLSHA